MESNFTEVSHKIPEWAEGETIIDYLSRRIVAESKTRLRRFVAEGRILVNGHKVSSGITLRKDDLVTLPECLKTSRPAGNKSDIEILYEDADHLAVNKPAGLTVSASRPREGLTIYESLLTALNRGAPGEGPYMRPHIVHRLDRETSGVLLVAKNAAAARSLSSQFQNRTIGKSYIGIVEGVFPKEKHKAVIPLRKDSNSGISRMRPDEALGKEAVTEIEVIKRYKSFTLLKLLPLTGRQHQLRVHLMALGYPLAVDFLYGNRERLKRSELLRIAGKDPREEHEPDEVVMNRTPLHAESITYRTPGCGVDRKSEARLPGDITGMLGFLDRYDAAN